MNHKGTVKIRNATHNDVTVIHRLIELYKFRDAEGQPAGSLLPLTESDIRKVVKQGNFFVADADEHVVGCVSLIEYDIAELRSLAVDNRYQGRGLGGRLIERCKEEARRRGYKELYALVQKQTSLLFQKHGFTYTERPPEKLERGCSVCPLYKRGCNENAMVFRFV